MAILTPGDIEYIRAMSGDDCGNPDDYEVKDPLLQKLYDKALLWPACGCTAADSLDLAVIQVLRVRVAKAQKLYNENVEGGSGSVKQKRDHLVEDLERWESKCGLSGGLATIGTLDMGLDNDCETSENASPYHGYWSWGGFYSS